MANALLPRFWDLVELAAALEGVQAMHLAIGKPPMVRLAGEGLQPLGEDLPVVTWKSIQLMMASVVEPEAWARLEQVGEGEFSLSRGAGRPIRLVLFRNSEFWSAVVHL